jgi:hypothetical protein
MEPLSELDYWRACAWSWVKKASSDRGIPVQAASRLSNEEKASEFERMTLCCSLAAWTEAWGSTQRKPPELMQAEELRTRALAVPQGQQMASLRCASHCSHLSLSPSFRCLCIPRTNQLFWCGQWRNESTFLFLRVS